MHKTVAVRHVFNTLSGRSMPIHSPEACTQHGTYQEKLANFLQRWAVLLQEALFRVMHIHRPACRLQAPFGEMTSGAEACMLKEKPPLNFQHCRTKPACHLNEEIAVQQTVYGLRGQNQLQLARSLRIASRHSPPARASLCEAVFFLCTC